VRRKVKHDVEMTGRSCNSRASPPARRTIVALQRRSTYAAAHNNRWGLELVDYTDFLRQHGHELWPKDHEKAVFIRRLCYRPNMSYTTYSSYITQKGAANAANTMVCVVHQANYLLDQLLRQLDKAFLEEGGFTERLHRLRTEHRRQDP
jgi:four helix bundle suffix protein